MNEQVRGQTATSKTRKASNNPVHRHRLENLKVLVKDRFKGTATHCANAIGRSLPFLWQLLNGYRAMGEDTARMIEQKLGLGAGTLDKPHGSAFVRNMVLVAQLGDGHSRQIVMVPVVTASDTVAGDSARRKKMSKAKDHVPCHSCTEDAYAVVVDFTSMEPRFHRGDKAVIEPSNKVLEDDKVYWIRPKGDENPVMRVAVKKDTGRFMFVTPPENRKNGEQPLSPDDVKVLGRVMYLVRDI